MAVSVKPAALLRGCLESHLGDNSRGTHAGPRAMIGAFR